MPVVCPDVGSCKYTWTTRVWIAQIHLYTDFFSIVNTVVLHDPQFIESVGAELRVRRANYKLYSDFGRRGGQSHEPPLPPLFMG